MNNIFKKKNTISKLLIFLICALLFVSGSINVYAEVDPNAQYAVDSDYWNYWPQAEGISGRTACLMDADTGTILYSKGLDAQRFPASITKVMTALIVAENCQMDEQVVMTETGMADAYAGSSNCNPKLGEVFTVRQCLELLLVKSANDIASQLAEHTAGSVQGFATMMNEKAIMLGCTNTNFVNASGLEDPNHYTSARDMAIIMQAAIQNDIVREIMAMPSCSIPATNMSDARYYESHNYLMNADSGFYYEGCMGGKTGYTDISQSTLVCCAQRNNMTLIGVVLGAPESESNARDMITIFDYGFNNFYRTESIPGTSCISGGMITLPNGMDPSQLTLTASHNGDNEDIALTVDDHIIGRCTVSAAEYEKLKLSKSEGAVDAQSDDASGTHSGVLYDTDDGTETEIEETHEKSPILYIIMIGLGAAILIGIIYILLRNDKRKRRRRRRK